MTEQLSNIVWMSEEIDFDLPIEQRAEAEALVAGFLESAGGEGLSHSIYPARA